MISTSLIVSTYNWPEALELCLKSILNLVVLPSEVIIADDGSGLETENIVNEYKKLFSVPLIHVWHPDKGFRKALILNKAVNAAGSDYIIQIDGDVILDQFFVHDHILSVEKNAFIRGTRAMISEAKTERILKSKNIKLSAFDPGIKNWNNAIRCSFLRRFASKKRLSSKSVRGSNLSYFKEDFVKVNGYNNNLTGWGHEDEELAARFINNGIIKKIIKLIAVQYHLYHSLSIKDNEPAHVIEIEKVLSKKVKFCENGYSSIDNE